MGGRLSVDDCASSDNPRVRECCHLEGETPIEIRIAYQHPRPAPRYMPATDQVPNGRLGGTMGYEYPFERRGAWPVDLHGMGKAAQPPPRAVDGPSLSSRHGPPAMQAPLSGAHSARRAALASQASAPDEFDPDVFVAPPDSEAQGETNDAAPARLKPTPRTPTGHRLPHFARVQEALHEDDYFPEIIRVSFDGGGFSEAERREPEPVNDPHEMAARSPSRLKTGSGTACDAATDVPQPSAEPAENQVVSYSEVDKGAGEGALAMTKPREAADKDESSATSPTKSE
eukprot:gnl/TRDRNA2_/TRDRNA2_191330_c0_seq1.p1 gnl/TRDRNA2_/TRDRNA2_191330_c0~~gnl/TRDRNA2_/TRDRNA2_191330_c0_seq1.p1  ORF type:complete len:286 (-),score=47.69 gnl/TRDRNA2_/TRDRNA2_191330_c0_seq1:123-980(-)